MQVKVHAMVFAHKIWKHLKKQFNKNNFMNVMTFIWQLITQKWSTDTEIKKFYQQYKNTKMTIEEVQPQLKVTLISIFLYAVQNSFLEFALNIEQEL